MKLDTSSYYPKSHLDDDSSPVDDAARLDDTTRLDEPDAPQQGGLESLSNVDAVRQRLHIPTGPDTGYESEPAHDSGFITMLCRLISWIMVPFFMPLYGTLFAFSLSLLKYVAPHSKFVVILVVAIINIVIPVILVLLLKWLGIVSDYGLNGRRERLIPYLITVLCFLGTAWFVHSKGAPMWFTMFFVGGAAAGLFDTIVNFWWKISAHAAGAAGVVALLIRIMRDGYPEPSILTWLIIAIAATGLVASARLWLGRHTLGQVLAGMTVGFCSVFFMTMIQ